MSACDDVYTVNDRFMYFFRNHFVHAMQYYFHLVSKSHDEGSTVCLIGKHKSHYVNEFIERIKKSKKYENIIFSEYGIADIPKGIKCITLHCSSSLYKSPWFTSPSGSRFMRDTLIGHTAIRKKATIGIINRTSFSAKGSVRKKGNRRLLNSSDVVKRIKAKTGIIVDETNFDDKSFDEQIQFCNDHDIIISPHGAQMCSIPFMPDYGVVVEICHELYYLDWYFKPLALQSGKGHLFYCKTHDKEELKKNSKVMKTEAGRGKCRDIDITVDVNRLVGAVLNALRDRDAKIRKGNIDDLLELKI